MSDKPLVNAPIDPPPVPQRDDEPLPDPGGKMNYPVVAAEDVIPDHGKTNYPVDGGD